MGYRGCLGGIREKEGLGVCERAGEERGKLSRGFASKMEEERSEGGDDSSSSQLLLQSHEEQRMERKKVMCWGLGCLDRQKDEVFTKMPLSKMMRKNGQMNSRDFLESRRVCGLHSFSITVSRNPRWVLLGTKLGPELLKLPNLKSNIPNQ